MLKIYPVNSETTDAKTAANLQAVNLTPTRRAQMKVITTLLITSLFAATANAGGRATDVYGGFAKGSSELSQWVPSTAEEMTGVATTYAGNGTRNIYGGFAKGNSELSQWLPSTGEEIIGVATTNAGNGTSNIYGEFAKSNSELSQWLPSAGEEMTGVRFASGDASYGLGGS